MIVRHLAGEFPEPGDDAAADPAPPAAADPPDPAPRGTDPPVVDAPEPPETVDELRATYAELRRAYAEQGTRLAVYGPLRHPKAPSLSLTGFRLVVDSTTLWGLPCCVRFPCVHAVATTPAQRLGG